MRVQPPDLTGWLTDYVRACALADAIDLSVGSKESAGLKIPLVKPVVVIRVDPGARLSHVTFDRSIGASVLAGTRQNDKPANDLARWLAGVLHDDAIALVDGSPIASVEWDGCTGPLEVADPLDVARRYLTAQYTVVGTW